MTTKSGQKKNNHPDRSKTSSDAGKESRSEQTTKPDGPKNSSEAVNRSQSNETSQPDAQTNPSIRLNQSDVQQNANPGVLRNSPNTTLIVTVITALTTIIGAILASPILVPWFESVTAPRPTAVLLTATPIPYARIQSLDVIQDGSLLGTVNPGQAINVTAGSNVIVKVNTISNPDQADLVFVWEFCEPGNDVKGQGAVEIPYRVGAKGQDCLVIKIEKGGEVLDIARFLVSIK